jgi:2-hydroxy-3-keto-5-methylthiopentenyl-1-phosphate phosphatase
MTNPNSEKIFKIFTDFDGTITKTDIGETLFKEFGQKDIVEKTIKDYLDEKISAKDCWDSLSKAIKFRDKKELFDFIDKVEIDETFHDFVKYCQSNKYDLYILSDGFDFYIDRIFEREGLSRLIYFSNKMEFTKENKLIPHFPFLDLEYKNSANCKRNHIINLSGDDEYTVFIGDGFSDRYTVQFCDFIFAKDTLLKYCEAEKITYFPYKNFLNIISKIEKLKQRKRLKKRHQAVLKRKEAYMCE